ncbi:MAG: UDP-glucose 4-epimerase GalE, partial [Flavobacteriaceae bacterium]|nr:UDP-glucose 4-epimerase GalE [Flavobacteriaceae bacterium]
VESVTGQSVPVVWGDRRVGDAPQLVAQPGAFAQHTGWTPEYTTIQTIIQTAWQWHQRNTT